MSTKGLAADGHVLPPRPVSPRVELRLGELRSMRSTLISRTVNFNEQVRDLTTPRPVSTDDNNARKVISAPELRVLKAAELELRKLLTGLEELKASAAALQLEAMTALADAIHRREAALGIAKSTRGNAIVRQVALAVRQSPTQAARLLSAAQVLTQTMPHTFGELKHGRLSEYRALTVVSESAGLDPADRKEVDQRLHETPFGVQQKPILSFATRTIARETRRIADAVNPTARAKHATKNYRESIGVTFSESRTPGLACLTVTAPIVQGVAIFDRLRAATETVPHGSQGIAMVNLLVDLVTKNKSSTTQTPNSGAVPITVNLVLSDATLFGLDEESPALLGHTGRGYGHIPARIARQVIAAGIDTDAAWLRRIYADPGGHLVAMTSQQRCFSGGLAHAIRIRDRGICVTPWCGAPARHTDHITPHASGGQTSLDNGASLCAKCNLTKDTTGWKTTKNEITDPTGTNYPTINHTLPNPGSKIVWHWRPLEVIFEKAIWKLTS